MQKLLEALKEDFLVTVENNGDYQQATSIDGVIIIFYNELLGVLLTIDILNVDDGIIDASWLAYLTFENGKIVDWVIRSTTALDFERTKYLNELLAPYIA